MRAGEWDYCPWQHLGDLDGVELRYHRSGEAGITVFDSRTISLRAGMSGAQRRSTLAHELVHLERGPVPEGATASVEEYLAECTALLRLIPTPVLDSTTSVGSCLWLGRCSRLPRCRRNRHPRGIGRPGRDIATSRRERST